jgi:hypothetical protein
MAKPDIAKIGTTGTAGEIGYDLGKMSLLSKTVVAGSGTVGGPGTVTISNDAVTTSSIVLVVNTLAARALAVTTVSTGSFVVTGTAADTFDYVVLG